MLYIFIFHLSMPVNPGEIKSSLSGIKSLVSFFGDQFESESEQDLKTGLNRILQDKDRI